MEGKTRGRKERRKKRKEEGRKKREVGYLLIRVMVVTKKQINFKISVAYTIERSLFFSHVKSPKWMFLISESLFLEVIQEHRHFSSSSYHPHQVASVGKNMKTVFMILLDVEHITLTTFQQAQ